MHCHCRHRDKIELGDKVPFSKNGSNDELAPYWHSCQNVFGVTIRKSRNGQLLVFVIGVQFVSNFVTFQMFLTGVIFDQHNCFCSIIIVIISEDGFEQNKKIYISEL